jgi:hypothetical protein
MPRPKNTPEIIIGNTIRKIEKSDANQVARNRLLQRQQWGDVVRRPILPMSPVGTNAKCRRGPEMSAVWGRPDISPTCPKRRE